MWEGNAGTDVFGINHTANKFIAVVWVDIKVEAFLSKLIADTWVEDCNILLSCVCVPERELGDEGAMGASGEPWRTLHDDNVLDGAKDFFDSFASHKSRDIPLLVSVNTSLSLVEVVRVFDRLNEFPCSFVGHEDGWVNVSKAVAEIEISVSDYGTAVSSNSALFIPEVGRVGCSHGYVNSSCWGCNQSFDYGIPEVKFATELLCTLGESILFSNKLSIPEVFVLCTTTHTISVLSVKAENYALELWKGIQARNGTVELNLVVASVKSAISDRAFLVKAEWVLVFLDVNTNLLTEFKIC